MISIAIVCSFRSQPLLLRLARTLTILIGLLSIAAYDTKPLIRPPPLHALYLENNWPRIDCSNRHRMKIEVWSCGGLDGSIARKWTVVFHRVKYAINFDWKANSM